MKIRSFEFTNKLLNVLIDLQSKSIMYFSERNRVDQSMRALREELILAANLNASMQGLSEEKMAWPLPHA